MYDITNAFVWNVSFKYNYNLNKTLSFSFEPTYINQLLYFKENPINLEECTIVLSGGIPLSISQVSIPILLNYRFKLLNNVDFLSSFGIGGLLNLEKSKKLLNDDGVIFIKDDGTKYYSAYKGVSLNFYNVFSYEFLIRIGFELKTKHNVQILLSYRFSPNKDYFFSEYNYNRDYFRVTMLELGIGYFI